MDQQGWDEYGDGFDDGVDDGADDALADTGALADDVDTADLDRYAPLGATSDTEGDGDGEPDQPVRRLNPLDEPLGTESATADFDATLADAADRNATADDGAGGDPAQPSVEALFGADPDPVPGGAGDDGYDFPPDLTGLAGLPEPVDGPPWTDPAILGTTGPDTAPQALAGYGAPEPTELAAYDGGDAQTGSDWDGLRQSEDPATSALARWWAPS